MKISEFCKVFGCLILLTQVVACLKNDDSAEAPSNRQTNTDSKPRVSPLGPPILIAVSSVGGLLSGASPLNLTGSGFASGIKIRVGNTDCGTSTFVNSNQAVCILPPKPAGTYSITIVNSDGQSATLPDAYTYAPTCGGIGDSCYDNDIATEFGTAILSDGVTWVTLVSSNTGFKVWREKTGDRILHASGLWSEGWQKQLVRSGRTYGSSDFTNLSILEGRVCPTHTFTPGGGLLTTNECIYYRSEIEPSSAGLNDYTGVEGEDFLAVWNSANTGNGADPSWYEGNFRVCANDGMRLPTLYETTAADPIGYAFEKPTDANPIFGGTGVPSRTNYTYTASASLTTMHGAGKGIWLWDKTFSGHNGIGSGFWIRCVLP